MVDDKISPFRNAILCDDIRNERGNKHSLMGVFSGDLVVAKLPAQVYLALYFEHVSEKAGELDVALKLWLDQKEVLSASIKIKPTAASRVSNLVLPRGLLKIERESELRFTAAIGEGPPIELLRKKILLNPALVT